MPKNAHAENFKTKLTKNGKIRGRRASDAFGQSADGISDMDDGFGSGRSSRALPKRVNTTLSIIWSVLAKQGGETIKEQVEFLVAHLKKKGADPEQINRQALGTWLRKPTESDPPYLTGREPRVKHMKKKPPETTPPKKSKRIPYAGKEP